MPTNVCIPLLWRALYLPHLGFFFKKILGRYAASQFRRFAASAHPTQNMGARQKGIWPLISVEFLKKSYNNLRTIPPNVCIHLLWRALDLTHSASEFRRFAHSIQPLRAFNSATSCLQFSHFSPSIQPLLGLCTPNTNRGPPQKGI